MSKKLLSEDVKSIQTELNEVYKSVIEQLIIEGVDDPGILHAVFMAGGPGCFVDDTVVKTTTGHKKISEIVIGDMVYTINEDTKEIEIKPVVATHRYDTHTDDLLELEFEDGVIVRCTENHKFYVDGEWIEAKNLQIKKTNLGKCTIPTYDLTVMDNSNYQITEKNIIVHNSGKSYIAQELFGIDKTLKQSFSQSGLKVVNSDTAFEYMLKKNGIDSKQLSKIESENPELWDKIVNDPSSIRNRAKQITNTQKEFYEAGRLGMIIDGTGDDVTKISKQKRRAEQLGYDTYMVFVNTSLEVAMSRNRKRDRVLPDSIVTAIWRNCQENLGAFQGLFSGNMIIVDNTEYGPIAKNVQKAIDKFVSHPIKNPVGKAWIKTARELKSAKMIK
jgi:predicted kinase